MKGYVFDIRHYSVHDGPGIRTAVFLKGCPLRCRWCHNPESHEMHPVEVVREKRIGDKLLKFPETIGKVVTPAEVLKEVLKSRIFFEESGGGVTFTGGEPLMQPGFLKQCMQLMREQNIHIALDTCGYAQPDLFGEIIAGTDLILFDLKHTDTKLHQLFTGGALLPILRNLRSEALESKPVIIRIPLVPGFNMSLPVYEEMAEILSGIKSLQQVDLLPYHYMSSHKYTRLGMENKMNGVRESSEKEVNDAALFFRNGGYKVTIGG